MKGREKMIIKAIAQLCKKSKHIQIYESDTLQYIGDGAAIYPLYKMPRVTNETVFTIFDIQEKASKKMVCKIEALPKSICVDDIDDLERRIESSMIELSYSSHHLIPLKCSVGLVFIDASYLKPVADSIDIDYYERQLGNGDICIALKSGMILHGIVMPMRIITENFVDAMKDLTEECELAYQNMKFEADKSNDLYS